MSPKLIIIAFDLYGTLLSTSSITSDLASTLHISNDKADDLATKWRQYQLEYTWRLAAMGGSTPPYVPFDKITRASLLHAANEAGLHVAASKADDLMRAYDGLTIFDDVLPALQTLRDRAQVKVEEGGNGAEGVYPVVFSNGTPQMLASSVATSPVLKLFQGGKQDEDSKDQQQPLFKKLISVDEVRLFKPRKDVYEHLQRAVTSQGDWQAQAAVWLVSSNPFDVVGAKAAGMRAAWVDRAGTGWVDQLGEVIFEASGKKQQPDLRPTVVARGVDQAVDAILKGGI